MLKHEDISETPSRIAAQARVTPEELAAAITRLEARKDAGQRHIDGTIPIGEAVQQLGLETTPEEVLAEVQAGRRLAKLGKRRPSIGKRLVLLLGLGGIILGLAVDGNRLLQMRSHETPASVSVSNAAPMPIQLDRNLLVNTASGDLVALSKVGDNQPVRCRLSSKDNQLAFYQWTPGTTTQNSWILIKHGGVIYVRGWTCGISPSAMERDGLELRANPNQAFNVPITLPIQGFNAVNYYNSEVRFQAKSVRLDRHANEKWQP